MKTIVFRDEDRQFGSLIETCCIYHRLHWQKQQVSLKC